MQKGSEGGNSLLVPRKNNNFKKRKKNVQKFGTIGYPLISAAETKAAIRQYQLVDRRRIFANNWLFSRWRYFADGPMVDIQHSGCTPISDGTQTADIHQYQIFSRRRQFTGGPTVNIQHSGYPLMSTGGPTGNIRYGGCLIMSSDGPSTRTANPHGLFSRMQCKISHSLFVLT